ncbi:MAG: hypothetical protein E7625_03070 [Ruminococcaceae bacterium]|nr:hypothetical protein [Oscillospiraceae bacterium]
MKNVFTRTVIFIFVTFTILLLVACADEHMHNFSSGWTQDESNHWHICTGGECTETSEIFAHTFDDGQITVEPSEQGNGELTYTCTVCGYAKTEQIAFTGITEQQYIEMIKPENYDNCTITVTSPVLTFTTGATNTLVCQGNSTCVIEWDNDKIHLSLSYDMGDGKTISTNDFLELTEETKPMMQNAYQFFTQISYDRITYDAATQTYIVSGEFLVSQNDLMVQQYKDIVLTFKNGKVVAITGTLYGTLTNDSNISAGGSFSFTIDNFGTTAVTRPSEQE